MSGYLARRLGWALFTVAFVIVLNFFLFRVMGDPTRMLKDPRLSQASIAAMQTRFGLDKPVVNCFTSLNPLLFSAEDVRGQPVRDAIFRLRRQPRQGRLRHLVSLSASGGGAARGAFVEHGAAHQRGADTRYHHRHLFGYRGRVALAHGG